MQRPALMIERRPRPKVKFVARKRNAPCAIRMNDQIAVAALRTSPMDRTAQDVDIIMSVVGSWPAFMQFVNTEQERREICRRITLEEYERGDIVIKQGDEPDAWYLIFSGGVTVYQFARERGDESGHRQIPPNTIETLRACFGQDRCFVHVANKGPTEEFGSTALTKNDIRNATIYVNRPSLILRVDPHLYRETVAWFAQMQLEKKAVLLSKVAEFSVLRDLRDIFSRLAENMEKIKLDKGTIINSDFFGHHEGDMALYIIDKGLVAQHRIVNFAGHKYKPKHIEIQLPRGERNVKVREYTTGEMFPDPAMKECVQKPFTISVIEPTTVYQLRMKDLAALLLNSQLQRLIDVIKVQPLDEEVIDMWIERQESVQWETFKHKCVKEARKAHKVQKAVAVGEWGMRKCGPPKSIKEHRSVSMLSATPRRPVSSKSMLY